MALPEPQAVAFFREASSASRGWPDELEAPAGPPESAGGAGAERKAAGNGVTCRREIRDNAIYSSVPIAAGRSYSPMSLSDNEDPVEMIRQSGADPQVLGRIWQHYRDRLRRVVRLRLDRRLQGRADPSDVLQEAFLDFQSRAAEYAQKPDMPFFLWLRFLTGQRLQLVHRHHLGTQMRDAGREVSLHRGAMPQATSVSLAAQLLGRFTSVTQAVQRAEMQRILQDAINELDPIDREILALRHFEELSNDETAQVLGIKPSAASNRHIRALKHLRDVLKSTPGFFDKDRE
jgi:RNA polymerase sigma-70 factor, ECF subfamily